MSSTTLHVERPYDTLDEYLEGDAWTVDRSDMVLVGAEGAAPGASVKFEIALATGQAVVKGEGRVVEAVAATADRPAGLRVRFRQLDSASKTTLKRALEAQKRAKSSPMNAAPPPPPPAEKSAPAASPEPVADAFRAPATSMPEITHDVVELSAADLADLAAAADPPAPSVVKAAPISGTRNEPSGVHHRVHGPITAPANRDELLARLRDRKTARRGSAAE